MTESDREIIETARELLGKEDVENVHSEYQRAIVEMSTRLLERPMADANLVAYAIGAHRPEQYDY